MTIPADRTFVNEQRGIIDPWLKVIERLDKLSPIATADKVRILLELIAAAGDPEAVIEAVNAFSSISAFNETTEADGGIIEANVPADELSIVVKGAGSIETDPASRALGIALSAYTAIIPGMGLHIPPVGLNDTTSASLIPNRMYVSAIEVPSRRAITALNFNKDAVGSGNVTMNLYFDNGGKPGLRCLEGGQTSVSGGGLKSLAVSATIPGGLYWVSLNIDNGMDAVCMGGNGVACLGLDAAFDKVKGYYRAATFPGLLPDETDSVWSVETGNSFPVLTIS